MVFEHPVDGQKQLHLNSNLRVEAEDGNAYNQGSYAVVEVERVYDRHGAEREIDRKAAKLLSELDGKGQTERETIGFVRDTFEAYTNKKKLDRLRYRYESCVSSKLGYRS